MHTQIAIPEKVELYLPDLKNHLLIENNPGGVVIRATRNNVSRRRREFLIRHLAAEGYIPDLYQWFSETTESGFLGVTWIAESRTGIFPLRQWCTRRNGCYGFLFIVWLIVFVWASRHYHAL